ncbi:MAG: amino acid ABC transporter permease [Spirulina sp.]
MSANERSIPLWRDDRFWKIALQILAVLAAIAIFTLLGYNLNVNMQRAGIKFGFDFLQSQASFAIGESLINYDPSDPVAGSYARVMLAGLVNTLRVVVLGIILTTILGIAAGVASFSDNWLLRKISQVYVEIARNIPILVQLLFWYLAVFSKLPRPGDRFSFFGIFYASKRGLYMPWPGEAGRFGICAAVLVVGAIAAIFVWRSRTKAIVEGGESGQNQAIVLWVMAIVAFLILLFGLGWEFPHEPEEVGQIEGGLRLTLELSALLVGLVIYTGAFISEIVRAGIQSVAKGQWEASRALGLRSNLTMRLVVFPQALRVIIPPLNSQYQNLAKNSSLALAIAYPDIYSVSNTTFNQTGRPIEVMLLIMVTYLLMNMVISFSMNQLNRSVQLKER